MNKAITVASGGLDSTVALAWGLDKGYEMSALHVNYGQLTEKRELDAFHAVCDHYDITDRLVVNIGYLAEIGCSSLTDRTLLVEQDGVNKGRIPSTYVPFRNANILSIAVSRGEVTGASKIIIGAVDEDSSGYPDCTEVFYERFNALLKVGLKPEASIEVEAPLIKLSKGEIVKMGLELKAPLELTWSCYLGHDAACGICDSCRLRLSGFSANGVKDPIRYR